MDLSKNTKGEYVRGKTVDDKDKALGHFNF